MKSNLTRFVLLAAALVIALTAIPALAEMPAEGNPPAAAEAPAAPAAPPAPGPGPAPQPPQPQPLPWWEVNPVPQPRTRTRVVVRQAETIISNWEAYGIATTAIKKVNVRSQASISSSRVAVIRAIGTEVEVTARVKNSSGEVWYAVTLANGTLGYIRSDLLNTQRVTIVGLDAEYAENTVPQGIYTTPEPVQQIVYVTPPPAAQPQVQETPTPILVYITPTPEPASAEPEVTPQVIYIYQEKENG